MLLYLDTALIFLCLQIVRRIKPHRNSLLIGLIATDIFVALALSLYMLSGGFTYMESLVALGAKDVFFLAVCCYLPLRNKACLRVKQVYMLSAFINYLFLFISQLYHPALYLVIFTFIPILQLYYISKLTTYHG